MTPAGGRVTSALGAVAAALDRLLPVWFVVWSLNRIRELGWTSGGWDLSFVGRDFWIYQNAALAVLHGDDPWAASSVWNGTTWHFAAPPTAAQLFVPFAVLGDSLGLALFLALSVGLAWLALRRLGLPLWWLAFPPMAEGILAANPQVPLFGLLILGGAAAVRPGAGAAAGLGWPLARAAATGLKIYALSPIVARREWRALVAVAGLLALSVVVGAGLWARYLTEFGAISSRVVTESEGGLSAALFLRPGVFGDLLAPGLPAAVAGLAMFGLVAGLVLIAAVRDVGGAGWIAAPLLFPAAEYHLATMAIPAARRLAIWVIAVPTIPTYLLGLVILAYQVAAGHRAIAADPGSNPIGLSDWLHAVRRSATRRPVSSAA